MNSVFMDAKDLTERYSQMLDKPIDSYAGYMSTKILDEFSIQLVNYRIENQLNQKQLARVLGVTQPMISQYEAGTNNISINRLCEICEKIGIRVKVDYERTDSTSNGYSNNPYRYDTEDIELGVA